MPNYIKPTMIPKPTKKGTTTKLAMKKKFDAKMKGRSVTKKKKK